ncbi:MAG TPA: phosphonate ABC transporter, permease protein PhnE [Anaerolineaceae bacterium]|nr:phosphonate ABC transporter, permease protein PhnE [Anaerolineaceae bacterium]
MKFAIASLIIPGLGQFLSGRRARGWAILGLLAVMIGLGFWSENNAWFIAPALVWIWNVWDAASPERPKSALLPVVISLVMFFVLGWQATEIDLGALTRNYDRVMLVLRPMTRPDFVEPREERREGWVTLYVPCNETPPSGENTVNDIHLQLSAGCAKVGDQMTVTGSGLIPGLPAKLIWQNPIGGFFPLREAATNQDITVPVDDQGNFSASFIVPEATPPGIDPNLPQDQRLYIRQARPIGGVQLSLNGGFVLKGIYETIALALMATTIGTILAFPISFIAARNLMDANAFTRGIYFVTRTILNIVRSIESLIIAIIFVVIVGLGPFAGMLALAVHTMAALGKLFSEMVEGIDPGPIEAIKATGGNWFQIVRYGVIPQIIPSFTAFTIYRWDINVRASTIIGFVGGGGIGFFLVQWINLGDFRAVSASFIAILVVVMIMDFFSAQLRARLAA